MYVECSDNVPLKKEPLLNWGLDTHSWKFKYRW